MLLKETLKLEDGIAATHQLPGGWEHSVVETVYHRHKLRDKRAGSKTQTIK